MDMLAPGLAAALATMRTVHMVATLSLAGALSFRLLVAPYSLARVVRPSLVVALLGGLAWLVLQAAALAGADTVPDTLAAIVPVVQDTRFGHVLLLRLALLLAAGALAWRGEGRARLIPAALIAAIAVVLQAALGHAAASDDPVLEASLAVHLLAAAAWLGGLVPLWFVLRASGGEVAARRFSLLGVVAVGAIAATAFEHPQHIARLRSFPAIKRIKLRKHSFRSSFFRRWRGRSFYRFGLAVAAITFAEAGIFGRIAAIVV